MEHTILERTLQYENEYCQGGAVSGYFPYCTENKSSVIEKNKPFAQTISPAQDKKCKTFVFPGQYRNCFCQRINALVARSKQIITAIGMVMHDFHDLKTMTLRTWLITHF